MIRQDGIRWSRQGLTGHQQDEDPKAYHDGVPVHIFITTALAAWVSAMPKNRSLGESHGKTRSLLGEKWLYLPLHQVTAWSTTSTRNGWGKHLQPPLKTGAIWSPLETWANWFTCAGLIRIVGGTVKAEHLCRADRGWRLSAGNPILPQLPGCANKPGPVLFLSI